jgi:hypothetical protein
MFSLEKAREEVKQSFTVSLEKKYQETNIAHDIEAEVKFACDISGSMNRRDMSGKLYDDGTVNEIVKRFFAIAKELDDNGEMEMYPFSVYCEELKVHVKDDNYENYVKKEIMGFNKKKDWYFGGTNYVAMIKEILKHCNKKPQLILCVVDGCTTNKKQAKELIIQSAEKPIFWFFIGIGNNERFEFLESLDDMDESKRKIDNVDFKQIKDITKISNKELYDMISDEFVGWFYKAKELNIF